LTIYHHVELAMATLLELDRYPQFVPDQRSETRRLCSRCCSGVAVDDSNAHPGDCTSHALNAAERVTLPFARWRLTFELRRPERQAAEGPELK